MRRLIIDQPCVPPFCRLAAVLLLLVLLLPQPISQPRLAGAQEAPGQLIGDRPTSGVALLSWTGGTIEALEAAAAGATSFWVTHEGHFVGYVRSAPAFVNVAFRAIYPQGSVLPQPLLVAWPRPTPPPPPPAGRVDCEQVRCVAITFDDGPGQYNARVLEILAAHGARATFFVEGVEAERRPQALRNIHEAGHEIGNHAFDHADLTKLTLEQMRTEVDRTGDIVHRVTGVRPTLLRPPYGAYDSRVLTLGMPIILWSVDPRDWETRDSALVVSRVANGVRSGSIVLLHETHASTVEALPAIFAILEERGLVPVTVSELLGGALENGRVYTHR